MGNTIIQSMSRGQNGLQLLENFESQNFLGDQGWQVVNGVPTTTNVVAYSELRSFQLDLTYPKIKKTFTTPFRWSAGWFFDDPAQTITTFNPFIQWQSIAAPATWGIGVNNAISTTNYTMTVANVQSASPVVRTAGWHRFEILHDEFFDEVRLKIDGVLISTLAFPGLNFTVLFLGVNTFVGATAFGYWDLIQVTKSAYIKFTNLAPASLAQGALSSLYLTDGTPVSLNDTVVGGVVFVAPLYPINVPFDGYFVFSKTDRVLPLFRGPVQSFSGGDVWNYHEFNLGRRVSTFMKTRKAMRTDLEATSGINQSLFYFSRDMVGLTLTDLTDDEQQSLQRWWGYAKSGNVFSAAIDSQDLFVGKLTLATGGNATTITLDTTAGLNQKSKIMLTRANGQTFEVAEVKSIAGLVVTLQQALVEGYEIGDQVRHSYYWPFAITTDAAFMASLTNTKLKRWTAMISFKEAIL